jgi:hypothetical protein
MARCPVCGTSRIVIVVAPERRAFCSRCASRWVQEGPQQRSIVPGSPAAAGSTDLAGVRGEPASDPDGG